MNERIRELKELATIKTPAGHGIVKYVFSPEKFAELIVEACADVCYNEEYTRGSDYGAEILKRFGVEK